MANKRWEKEYQKMQESLNVPPENRPLDDMREEEDEANLVTPEQFKEIIQRYLGEQAECTVFFELGQNEASGTTTEGVFRQDDMITGGYAVYKGSIRGTTFKIENTENLEIEQRESNVPSFVLTYKEGNARMSIHLDFID